MQESFREAVEDKRREMPRRVFRFFLRRRTLQMVPVPAALRYMRDFDLVVIGAGPGGYEAALEAAQRYGMRTALVEKADLGGTCLNHGCIPTKTLLHSADLYRQMKEGAQFGIEADNIRLDMAVIQSRKEKVISQLRDGIAFRLKQQKVQVFAGTGRILDPHTVEVIPAEAQGGSEQDQAAAATAANRGKDRTAAATAERNGQDPGEAPGQCLDTEYILIATGSETVMPPIPGISLPGVMGSDELLEWNAPPMKHLLIIGGGVIGMEFASVFSAAGAKVTVIEALPRIIANMDRELSQSLKMLMKKRGVDIITDARVTGIAEADTDGAPAGELEITYTAKEKACKVTADAVLVCVGRKPYTAGLFDEALGIETDRGRIVTDESWQTSVPGIYAIGDVTGRLMLAHAATAAGRNAVEDMSRKLRNCQNGQSAGENMGDQPRNSVSLAAVPSCIYTDPEIASVGLTLDEAKEQGIDADSRKVLMTANGKTVLSGQERGFIKVVFEKESRKLLGAQLMCARASDIVSEFTQAIANGLTMEDMGAVIRPHPTFCEAVTDAVR